MAHLLHIDSSIKGELSVSRSLTARADERWREAHPGGTVTYRDFGLDPLPHLDAAGGLARMVPSEQHTPAQAASWKLTEQVVGDVLAADTILLGLPLYNFGPPSTVKAWVDHLIAPGLSVDRATQTGLLTGRELLVLASRGGGYLPGTPREGWDHAEPWLPHALEDDRPRATFHHRRTHPRRYSAADGRAARARRREPRCGRARDRRAVDAGGRLTARRSKVVAHGCSPHSKVLQSLGVQSD